jgi:RNA polymerase sigma-70 factor (ECF subfamily)
VSTSANPTVDEVLRIEGGRVLATLIRLTGDFDLAEDALQDACLEAVRTWDPGAPPQNPAAWLTATARNRALDRWRREAKRSVREEEAVRLLDNAPPPPEGRDDRLRLIFTCSHPALDPASRVALSLRTICGLATDEIAAVFLVRPATMGQRLSRAKRKISEARIPYRVPRDHELPQRLPAVLATVNAVYTAGHHPTHGHHNSRVDLAHEGIRLARLLVELMPDEPECHGLLALLLATEARRPARGGDGDMILLADQDRALWDRGMIEEATAVVDRTIRLGRVGPLQVQAAIASLHGMAPSYADTDWAQIAELYRALEAMQPTLVVRVNRAVAVAEAEGPAAALAGIDDLDSDWHYLWVVRAEMERRLGDPDAARRSLHRALTAPMNQSDRSLLERRLAGLSDEATA